MARLTDMDGGEDKTEYNRGFNDALEAIKHKGRGARKQFGGLYRDGRVSVCVSLRNTAYKLRKSNEDKVE